MCYGCGEQLPEKALPFAMREPPIDKSKGEVDPLRLTFLVPGANGFTKEGLTEPAATIAAIAQPERRGLVIRNLRVTVKDLKKVQEHEMGSVQSSVEFSNRLAEVEKELETHTHTQLQERMS